MIGYHIFGLKFCHLAFRLVYCNLFFFNRFICGYFHDRCTLPFYQSVGALYSPATVFTAIAVVVYLRVRCLILGVKSGEKLIKSQADSNRDDSSTNENDLDEIIVEQQQESMLQKEYEDSDDGEVDEEHSYAYQSGAQMFFLILYLLAWSCAAVYITNPSLKVFDPYQDIVFSGLYCLISTILGLFVFTFYCHFRSDVRRCMCKMLQMKTNDHMGSQQQSDITITTTVTQTTEATLLNDTSIKVVEKSFSPPPLVKVEVNPSATSSNHVDTLGRSDCSKRSQERTDKPFVPSGRLSPRLIISNSHAGLLNRDSSNSISSVAMTDRSRYTYHTLKSLNGFRSASPQTCIGFVHPVANATNLDVNYYNPQQQQIARKFFQRQREKRQRLNLKYLCKSESSRGEDTMLDTSINTSLTIPKQIHDNQVPNVQSNSLSDEVVDGRTEPVLVGNGNSNMAINRNEKLSPVPNGISSLPKNHRSQFLPNGHVLTLPSPTHGSPTKLLEGTSTCIDPERMCCSPSSVVSLSRRSVQSDSIGKKRHKRHHRHRDPKMRASSQSTLLNGSNSFPLRTYQDKRKKLSKMSRSISAYEQINNNNRDSTSSENEDKRVNRKPRSRQKHKNLLKKETSV